MKIRACLLILFLVSAVSASPQGDLQELKEFNILWTYEKIPIEWKMDGKIQAYLNDGLSNLDEDKVGEAEAAFDEVLKKDSSCIGLYYRSICYKLEGRFRLARTDLEKLIKIKNDLPQAQLELCKNLMLGNDMKGAKMQLENCIKTFPGYVHAYYLMGDVLTQQRQFDDARKFYKTCEKIDKTYAPAYVKIGLLDLARTNDRMAGLRFFNKALEFDSTQKEALWYRVFLTLPTNPKKSLKDINTLVRHNPTNLIFTLYRGLIRTEVRDFDGAWADMYKFITNAAIDQGRFHGRQRTIDKSIDVQNAGYYLVRQLYGLSDNNQQLIKKAYCLMFSSRNEEALKTINQTHELENTALYHFLLGLVYEHLGRHEEAWLHYDKTLQLDNDIFDAHQKRGIYSTNIEKWKDAELDFSEMIRINPENKFGYKLRSVTFYHQKEFEKSIADARKVLAVDSADCAVRSTLAFALMAISKYLPAFEEFERCQNYDALSLDVLSRIHTGVKEILATGDTTKALNYITRISNMRPAYETGAILKAEILEEQRKWDELTAFLDERISHIVTVNSQKYRDFLEKKKKMVSKKSRAQFNSAKP